MSQTETIGILGGGQLGRMLTEAAIPLGKKVIVIDPGANSPASQVGATQIIAALQDEEAIRELAKKVDVISVEIEHVNTKVMQKLWEEGVKINPYPSTISMIQDKLLQKHFLKSAGFPVADFMEIDSKETAEKARKHFGGKMIIKTRFGAYDGRGNMVVESPEQIDEALEYFIEQKLYAEKFVPFEKELAVMIGKDSKDQVVCYPVVETLQSRNICVEVHAPAQISESTSAQAIEIATKVGNHLEGPGVYGIEMFLTNDTKVLINEIAPRVHNSGHYTIEACETSQFSQAIRAISDMELGPTNMIVPAAVMINILGERNGPTQITGVAEAEQIPGVTVHMYGKSPTKIDRKMGHITATGKTLNEARNKAKQARALIGI
ncbi:MAG: 5-(carboxyamino)imidazole ribonucleotide synthase [Candidatus Saccharimonadales bacterium]